MADTATSGTELGARDKAPGMVPVPRTETPKQALQVGIIGGTRLGRLGLASLLQRHGLGLACEGHFHSPQDLQETLQADTDSTPDALVLILGGGPFHTIHRIRDVLSTTSSDVPLVILSQQIARGEVYAALRIGAKAYLNMDCDPDELVKAVRLAAKGKVHLAPDVAELLVNDVSSAFQPEQSQRLPSTELSRREVEIVQLLCEGLSSKEIARRLHLSTKTVENHRYNIYKKWEVDSIAALMRQAIQHGLVSI